MSTHRRPSAGLDRRELLGAAGALTVLGPAALARGRAPGARDERPNLLFVIADQHRAGTTGHGGDRHASTPGLDRLAAQGTVFTDLYCDVPLCLPARQSLITGTPAHRHGAYNNVDDAPSDEGTIAHDFARAGYATALFGKTHMNVSGFAHLQTKQDMKRAFAARHGSAPFPGEWHVRAEDAPYEGTLRLANPQLLPAGDGTHHMESDVTDESLRWMEAHGKAKAGAERQPFFLWASYVRPHPPRFPPQEWLERFRGVDVRHWAPIDEAERRRLAGFLQIIHMRCGLDRATRAELLGVARAYHACLAWTDHCIGRLLDGVERLGLDEDTLVVYTSDHGEMLGEHGILGKYTLFEGAARVPTIVRWPGRVKSGARVERVAGHLDLVSTLFDLCGVPRPERVEGRSLAPLLSDPAADWRDEAFAQMYYGAPEVDHFQADELSVMLRRRRFKYIRYGRRERELYDLSDDPEERRNLYGEPRHAERVRAWEEQIAAALPERIPNLR